MNRFHIGILTPKRLATVEEGEIVVDLLSHIYNGIAPERFGNYEPLKNIFDPAKPEALLSNWGNSVYWKRRSPRADGAICIPRPQQQVHGWIKIAIDLKANVERLVCFIQEASCRLNADFAHLHFLTERDLEIANANATGGCIDPKRGICGFAITTYTLKRYLPDIYWATIFGPAYIKHFGKKRLLTSPAYIVRELENGSVYIQISESPFDLQTNFNEVNATRRRVKEHLDNNAFFDPNLPAEYSYNIPVFELESINSDVKQTKLQDMTKKTENNAQPDISELVLSAANDAITIAQESYGVVLDYSESSVGDVENILDSIYNDILCGLVSSEKINTLAVIWGAYIGEVLRLNVGGEWYWEKRFEHGGVMGLRMGEMSVYPTARAFKRLTNGSQDSILQYYQVMVVSEKNHK